MSWRERKLLLMQDGGGEKEEGQEGGEEVLKEEEGEGEYRDGTERRKTFFVFFASPLKKRMPSSHVSGEKKEKTWIDRRKEREKRGKKVLLAKKRSAIYPERRSDAHEGMDGKLFKLKHMHQP